MKTVLPQCLAKNGKSMYQLRSYQTTTVAAIIAAIEQKADIPHYLAVLGTGAGKSLIIAEVIRQFSGKVLVLSRNKEICSQNSEKYLAISGQWPSIFNAGLGRKCLIHDAVFASAQSLANLDAKGFPVFDLVIIDECHQWGLESGSSAVQGKKIINICKELNPSVPVIGLTATPYRLKSNSKGSEYFNWLIYSGKGAFFKECLVDVSEESLTRKGYLAPIEYANESVTLFTGRGALVSGKDFKDLELARICDDETKIQSAIARTLLVAEKRSGGCLIFAATKKQAAIIYDHIPYVSKACIFGDTPTHSRDEYIREFKDGKIKYLVNVQVLTTGFDAPNISVMAIFRPTASYSLFRQIIGRGMRLFPGKKTCLLLDFTDNVERLSEVSDLSKLICQRIDSGEMDLPIEYRSQRSKDEEKVICHKCGWINTLTSTHCVNQIDEANGAIRFCGTLLNPGSCSICGEQNTTTSDMCMHCSSSLSEVEACLYCKQDSPENAPFCLHCGMSNDEQFYAMRKASRTGKTVAGSPVYRTKVDSEALKILTDYSISYEMQVNNIQHKVYAAGDVIQLINTLAPVLHNLNILKQCRMAAVRDTSGRVMSRLLHTYAKRIKQGCLYVYYTLTKKFGSSEVVPRIMMIDYQ